MPALRGRAVWRFHEEERTDMNYEPKMYQHLSAPNDTNGNPRRCFVIMGEDARVLDVIDEGYAGAPRWIRDLVQLPGMRITATEYRDWLRTGKALAS